MLTAEERALPLEHFENDALIGTVERVIFQNKDNGYCVLNVRPEHFTSDMDVKVKAVGYIPEIREGDDYSFTGEWKKHPKFGDQFQINEYTLLLPTTQKGIIRYLASVARGVGEKTAAKIVEALGDDCLQTIKEDPDSLRQLPFLKPIQAQEIIDHLLTNEVQAELAALICREGITPRLAAKIYQVYGNDAIKVVKDNPYVLSEDIWGIGFKLADKVARAVRIAADSPFRIKAAVDYLLREAGNEGHCYLRPREILGKSKELLGMDVETHLVAKAVEELITQGRVVREGDAIYATDLHQAECELAAKIREFTLEPTEEIAGLAALIDEAKKSAGITLAVEQRAAIVLGLSHPISIITGGPGTGKTTVINAICSIYEKTHSRHRINRIHLASPTGRAAQRMTEATGRDAQTIHRLLRYSPFTGEFEHNEDVPLPSPALVVIDEFSMCDVSLARDLFNALVAGDHKVILVGDVDQLPSVGPGSVLRDLIRCGQIPVTRLKFNYRQAGGSKIAEYANNLVAGIAPPRESAGDYEFILVDDDIQAVNKVIAVVRQALAAGMDPMDFQVLAPMHKGKCGVKTLNKLIRDLVNPELPNTPRMGPFRLGDKVMVIKNNYALGVFNGNMGVVTEIQQGESLTAEIDGTSVKFSGDDLELLTLAYAATIHKAQGSEFKLVIMPLLRHHYIMLQRNLLYTGMTRAKDRLVLISDGFGVKKAAQNAKVEERFSLLAERIRRAAPSDGEEEVQ